MRERETKQTREEEKNKEKPREKSRGVVAEALLDRVSFSGWNGLFCSFLRCEENGTGLPECT